MRLKLQPRSDGDRQAFRSWLQVAAVPPPSTSGACAAALALALDGIAIALVVIVLLAFLAMANGFSAHHRRLRCR